MTKRLIALLLFVVIMIGCSSSDNPAIPPPVGQEDQYFDITLAWNKNSEPNVIGYAIYYRNNTNDSHIWATSVNEDQLSVKLNFKKEFADWYFVATAYSIAYESDHSNEVKHSP